MKKIINPIKDYYRLIETGKITVPVRIRQFYSQLVDELEDPKSRYCYDPVKALKPIIFIETFCRHSKGEWAGKPVKLELFQKAFIASLFGVVDKQTGKRRFKQAFFEVGRKNGKSTMLAGIALYMLIADGESGAEVYTLATKRDQAKIIFNTVLDMVNQSPELKKATKKRRTDLYYPTRMSKMEPLSKDSNTMDGLNASCAIIDELHAIKDRNLYEVMYQSMASRSQPLLIMITTAGTVREGIFDQLYLYSCNLLDGKIKDDTFLPIIYELDKKEEWQDREAWVKANPALGSIKLVKDLEDKVNKAKQDPTDLTGLLTKDFNIRDTVYHAWLDFDTIDNPERFKLEDFTGSWFIGGVDLSAVNDLTCATALFMHKDDPKVYVEQMYWLPRQKMQEHLQTDKVPYDQWEERGLLRVCESNTVNYSDVTEWFMDLVNNYQISPVVICYDRWQASYWVQEMEARGFPLKACAQGAKTFSVPMKHLEAELKAKNIVYNDNPILKWCLTNTDVKVDDNENIRPVKSKSPYRRIDGTLSLLDAFVGLLERMQEFKEIV